MRIAVATAWILRGNDTKPVKLHSYWDTNLVEAALKKDPAGAAKSVMSLLTTQNRQKWTGGTASQWAQEGYDIAKMKVYAGVVDRAPVQTGYIFPPFHGTPDKCGTSNAYRTSP